MRLQMGLKQMKIATKLLTLLLGVGILPLLFMGWIVLEKSGAALSNQAFAQLESLRDVKKLEVERYFNRLHSQMVTFSENRMVVTSLRQLKQVHSGFGMENQVNPSSLPTLKQSLKRFYINDFNQEYRRRNDGQDSGLDGKLGFLEETTIALQYHYLLMNSNPIGEKNLLDKAGDQSTYTRIHEVYHPSFRNYAKEFNYSDLYLIDSETGHIIYSVSKGIDFGTSLRSGLFSESPFAAVFQHAADAQDKDAVSMSDFSLYPAAFNEPVLFIASPVVEGGSTIGVVAFQINSDGLNQIMNERSGMGETGETFLVGPDHLMLSDSITDSQNRSVVASLRRPKPGSVETVTAASALSGQTGRRMTANHSGQAVLSAYAPVSVKGAIWAMLAEIREAEAFSAVFQLKMAIGIIVAVGIALILPIAWLTTRSMTRPVYRIIRGLNVGADQVASAAWEVASASQQLAEGSSDQAAAIEETTASLEEMASMTSRNVESAGTATQLMTETSEVVNRADAAMSDLSRSMDNISAASNETSKIIRAIDDIAFQTNLLALNAAVEAARAGESAGASEELSAQTEQMKRMVQDLSSLIEGSPAPRKSAARPFSKWSPDESVSKSGNSGVAA